MKATRPSSVTIPATLGAEEADACAAGATASMIDNLDAQVHAHHFLYERNQKDEARAFDLLEAPERKDYRAFIFTQDAHRSDQAEGGDKADKGNDKGFD
jgi:hypothetical protein